MTWRDWLAGGPFVALVLWAGFTNAQTAWWFWPPLVVVWLVTLRRLYRI